MATGTALTIGLNSVDPNHYSGWSGELMACENDARDMARIAESQGFAVKTLLTKEATRENVRSHIIKAAESLEAGDIFLVTYSGHGGQLPDRNLDEGDGLDETWCLYDGELVDDELAELWTRFKAGVRILGFSDSCHSGTVFKARRASLPLSESRKAFVRRECGTEEPRYRFCPHDVLVKTYFQNRTFYDELIRGLPKEGDLKIAASVRLISGCQDHQYSLDGTFNGLFTGKLLAVWDGGGFTGDYKKFHARIVQGMPDSQKPNHFVRGASDPTYDAQRPFTV